MISNLGTNVWNIFQSIKKQHEHSCERAMFGNEENGPAQNESSIIGNDGRKCIYTQQFIS